MARKWAYIVLAVFIVALSVCRTAIADDGWVCQTCGRTNNPKANFCSNCGTRKPSPEDTLSGYANAWVCSSCGYTVPQEDRFCSVCGASHTAQDVPALRREPTPALKSAFQPGDIIKYPMTFSTKSGTKTIQFQAPTDGKYQIWIEDQMAGSEFKLQLKDNREQMIAHNSLYQNRPDLTEMLSAGVYYQITILYDSFQGECTLCVGVPRATQSIGDANLISDSMVFSNQINTYSFVAKTAGQYRVEVHELIQGNRISLKLLDSQGYKINGTSLAVPRGGSISEKFEAGKTYYIQAIQSEGLCDYTLLIGRPKPALDITGAEAVGDSMDYQGQENVYLLKPNRSVDYLISTPYLENADMKVDIRVCDSQGYQIKKKDYMVQNASFTLHLDGNDSCQIIVKQKEGIGEYTLLISEQ